jgi:hypothetical protein
MPSNANNVVEAAPAPPLRTVETFAITQTEVDDFQNLRKRNKTKTMQPNEKKRAR